QRILRSYCLWGEVVAKLLLMGSKFTPSRHSGSLRGAVFRCHVHCLWAKRHGGAQLDGALPPYSGWHRRPRGANLTAWSVHFTLFSLVVIFGFPFPQPSLMMEMGCLAPQSHGCELSGQLAKRCCCSIQLSGSAREPSS